jgi:lysine 2,3-aminomutase
MTPSATLRTADHLIDAGLAPPSARPALDRVAARYAVAITPAMAALMDPAEPADPIARQFMPDPAELIPAPGERADPIGDYAHSPVAGIVHRYPDRVLLKITHTCAVYCRFCFRREMVGPQGHGGLDAAELDAALAYVAADPGIWEVIVTGGDPLVLSPRRLADLTARLAAIRHVKVIRYHTRIPAVDPAAITPALIKALKSPTQTVYIALHANHARELTPQARAACARLIDAGLAMVSQSVLLRGVNDEVETLAALMRAFVETRIKPYYLHHADLAPGTAHLRVGLAEGQALMRALRARVSGLCMPTFMLDLPGGHGKAPVGPDYVGEDEHGAVTVEDPAGRRHAYPPSS